MGPGWRAGKGRARTAPGVGRHRSPRYTAREMGYFDVVPARLPPWLEDLQMFTKSGVRGAPGLDDAQLLLARTLHKRRVKGELLDLSAMGGLLATLPGLTVRAVEGSAPALAVLRRAGLEPVAAAPGDDLGRHAQVALTLAADRGSAYAEAQVSWAHASTRPGGTLYLAGDKDKGFERYLRRAAGLFGTGEVIARDGGMRVAALTRRPGPTPPQPAPERYEARGVTVLGFPGVFSAGKLDKASDLLLEGLEGTDLTGRRVLDLGCGAGVLGAWAAQRGATVTLLDADLQSVRSARATLEAGGLTGEVLHSDVDLALDPAARFDLILTNPPFHVGRGVMLEVGAEFVAAAGRRLAPGGELRLVANDFLPYEPQLTRLGALRELVRARGFKVLSLRPEP